MYSVRRLFSLFAEELEKEAQSNKALLDALNEVASALLELVPWRAREGLEKMVAEDNDHYRLVRDAVTQKVEEMGAALLRSQQDPGPDWLSKKIGAGHIIWLERHFPPTHATWSGTDISSFYCQADDNSALWEEGVIRKKSESRHDSVEQRYPNNLHCFSKDSHVREE
ncbi:Dystonin [Manis javanica]|nr:Dystonin [Manis javanica]